MTKKNIKNIGGTLYGGKINFGLKCVSSGEIERNVFVERDEKSQAPIFNKFKFRYDIYFEPTNNNYIVVECLLSECLSMDSPILAWLLRDKQMARIEGDCLIDTLNLEQNSFVYVQTFPTPEKDWEILSGDKYCIIYDAFPNVGEINEMLANENLIPHLPELLGRNFPLGDVWVSRLIKGGKEYNAMLSPEAMIEMFSPLKDFDIPALKEKAEELLNA